MTAQQYRPDIQGLRAVAVLAVIMFHFDRDWLPGGFVGVDIFLVISGFLITSILLQQKRKSEPFLEILKSFYWRRFKRIAPAYFFMLVLITFLAAIFFPLQDFTVYKEGLEKALWFNSNHYFADFGDYFSPASYEQPLLHTWSLAVEIQFYLIAPFLILFLPEKYLKWTLAVLLLLFTAFTEYRLRVIGAEQATYYSLFARLPAFWIGSLCYLMLGGDDEEQTGNKGNSYWALLGLTLIITAFLLPRVTGYFPGISGLVPVVGVGLLIIARHNLITRWLSLPVLVWIGALSYSLYLWHWPVLAFLRYYTGTEKLDLAYGLFFVTTTIALAIISYFWIETPLRKRTDKRRLVSYTVLFSVVLLMVGGMNRVNFYFTPEPVPVEYTRYADPETICHGKIVDNCLRGDLTSEREILVLGDSHAAMLNHFFDELGQTLNLKFRIITASSCITIPNFDYQRLPRWAHKSCLEQIDIAHQYLKKHDTIIVAGMWTYQLPSEKFRAVFKAFIKENRDTQIYVFSQIPQFTKNVMRVLRFQALDLPATLPVDQTYQTANKQLSDLIEHYPNVEFLSMDNLPLFHSAPFQQEILLYRDEHHLNEIGAKLYAEEAKELLAEKLSYVRTVYQQ